MMRFVYLVFTSLLVLQSCSQSKFDSEQALLDAIKNSDQGYLQQKTVNGYTFSLLYKPTDLLVKQELGDRPSQTAVVKLRDKYNKYLYFNLSISRNNKELLSTAPKNRTEFGAMVNQLAFDMQHKVHLFTQTRDTLKLADYIYPRLYGMSNATTIMFVYPRDGKKLKDKEYLSFTVEDLGLYTGEVKFKIPVETLMNEPQLSFDTVMTAQEGFSIK